MLYELDIIFLSRGFSLACENAFIAIRRVFPNIKRVHGMEDNLRARAVCSAIADTERYLLINATETTDKEIYELSQSLILGNSQKVKDSQCTTVRERKDEPSLLDFPEKINTQNLEKDIIYLTYDEPIADENFISILRRYPNAKRLHRVTGMTRAFALSAQLAATEWYVLIDGDNILCSDADLTKLDLPRHRKSIAENMQNKAVLTYGTINKVNDVCSCYGGIKVCPTSWFRGIESDVVDPIASRGTVTVFCPKDILSITNFNSEPFGAWKAGFREAVMLSSALYTDFRESLHWKRWLAETLAMWKSVGEGRLNGEFCIDGAREGEKFAQKQLASSHDTGQFRQSSLVEKLSVINEPGWLRKRFDERPFASMSWWHRYG